MATQSDNPFATFGGNIGKLMGSTGKMTVPAMRTGMTKLKQSTAIKKGIAAKKASAGKPNQKASFKPFGK